MPDAIEPERHSHRRSKRRPVAQRRRSARPAWIALASVLLPLLLLLFLTTDRTETHQQRLCLTLAGVTTILGLGGVVMSRRRGGNLLAGVCLGWGLIIACGIVWNMWFMGYVHRTGYSSDEFRGVFQNLHAPVYGRPRARMGDIAGQAAHHGYAQMGTRQQAKARRHDLLRAASVGAAALLVMAGGFLLIYRYGEAKHQRLLPMKIAGLQLLLILIVGFTDSGRLSEARFAGYDGFFRDVDGLTSTAQLLSQWTARMPSFGGFSQHYPPGNLLLAAWERWSGVPNLFKAMVIVATVASVFPLFALCVELGLSPRARLLALLLFATAAPLIGFPTTASTPLIILPGVTALWLWLRALGGDRLSAAGAGLALAGYAFFSLTVLLPFVMMALLALFGLVTRTHKLRNSLIAIVLAAAASVGFFVLLDVVFGFNFYACARAAMAVHAAAHPVAGDVHLRYLIRSSGMVLAFVIFSGFHLSVPAFMALGRLRDMARDRCTQWAAAVVATLLLAGFSGLFLMESERVWIVLVPLLAVAAGQELGRRAEYERHAVYGLLAIAAFTICMQAAVFVPWL